jgi:hypothetical protein
VMSDMRLNGILMTQQRHQKKPLLEIYHFLIYHICMESGWKVELSGKAKKASKLLSTHAYKAFLLLLMDLKSGPEVPSWPNYGKLGGITAT